MIPTHDPFNMHMPSGRLTAVRYIALGTALLFVSGAAVLGQQTPERSSPMAKPTLADELLNSLQQLKSLRQLEPSPDLTSPASSPPSIDQPTQSSDAERIQALEQRIELLRTILDRSSNSKTRGHDPSAIEHPSPSVDHPGQSAGESIHQHAAGNAMNRELTHGDPTHDFPMPSLEDTSSRQAGNQQSQHEDKQPASPSPKYVGETVIPNPVDPLELANSLFQTENYDLALKTYQAVAKKVDRPQDLLWAEYFMASCHRIKGDLSAAESGYRNLVESKRPSRAVETARFWLDRIEHRRNAEKSVKELETSLAEISQELEKNGR